MNRIFQTIARLFTDEPEETGDAPSPAGYPGAAYAPELSHPGWQLWLRPAATAGLQLAVDAYPSRTQGANNDNMLVMGGAGSGRSIMVARLTEAAYTADNTIFALTHSGPLEALCERVGGTHYPLTTPEQASFNPFLFVLAEVGEPTPSTDQLFALATVLANVLLLTNCSTLPEDGTLVAATIERVLVKELQRYYDPRNTAKAKSAPSFTSFYDFVEQHSSMAFMEEEAVATGVVRLLSGVFTNEDRAFYRWFTVAGQPFRTGGALGHLMNASPDQVLGLAKANRFLQVFLSLRDTARTEVDNAEFTEWPFGSPAPEATVRSIILLLHTVDELFGGRDQRLTVVLDELHYSLLGPQLAGYLNYYLKEGPRRNRSLIVAWHECPDQVFSDRNPAAQALLAACDSQIFATFGRTQQEVKGYDCLQLSDTTKELLISTGKSSSEADGRKVLVRIPADSTGEVFHAYLPREEQLNYWRERDPRRQPALGN